MLGELRQISTDSGNRQQLTNSMPPISIPSSQTPLQRSRGELSVTAARSITKTSAFFCDPRACRLKQIPPLDISSQLFVSFLTTMTGCNPELSFHMLKINTEVLECSHTHVSSRSTSTQEVNENDMMSDGCRGTREIMVTLWCPLLVECHGCHSLSCGRVFAVTDLIPCCCSLVECLIMALLIMYWPLMTLPLSIRVNLNPLVSVCITQQGHV